MGGLRAKERRRQQRQDQQQKDAPTADESSSKDDQRQKKREFASSSLENKKGGHVKRPRQGDAPSPHGNKKGKGGTGKKSNKPEGKKFKKPKHLKRKLQETLTAPASDENKEEDDRKEKLLQDIKRWEIQKKAHIIQEKQLRSKIQLSKKMKAASVDTGAPTANQSTHTEDATEDKPTVVENEKETRIDATPEKNTIESPSNSSKKESSRPSTEEDPPTPVLKDSTPEVLDQDKIKNKRSSGDSDDDDSVGGDAEPEAKRQRGRRRRGRRNTSIQQDERQIDTKEEKKIVPTVETPKANPIQTRKTTSVGKDTTGSSDDTEEQSNKIEGMAINEKESQDKRYCVGRKPVTDFVVGQSYTGKVVYVKPFGIFLDIGCHSDAFCHVSRLSDEYVESPIGRFSEGDEVPNARVIEIDRSQKRITVSLQSEHMVQQEKASIEYRQQRLEKARSKKKSKTASSVQTPGLTSKPASNRPFFRTTERINDTTNNTRQSNDVPPAHITEGHEAPRSAPAPPSKDTDMSLNKPESEMTPAELKRSRKLARRAARRAQAETAE